MLEWAREHKTLVVLGVRDQEELMWWSNKLHHTGAKCAMFIEPDDGVGPTALACLPEDSKTFRDLRLL